MVKLIDWGKHIRLGNWLFQYASLNSFCHKTGNILALPNYFLWDYLEKKPVLDVTTNFNELFKFEQSYYSDEKKIEIINYFESKKTDVVNIELNCFLQSERWFLDDVDYVKTVMKISDEKIKSVKDKYSEYFNKPTIGIGIRRGDFVGHNCFYQIPENWYEKVLVEKFPNYSDYNVIIFSDDIEWCKAYYKGKGFLFSDPNNTHTHSDNFKHYHKDPMEQFILGILCDNFIGGSSTFTWWQMWYVKNFNNGNVYHCGKNLAGDCFTKYYNPDYYPENWEMVRV